MKTFPDCPFSELQIYLLRKHADEVITHPPAFMELQDPDGCQYMRGQHVLAVVVKFEEEEE